MKRLAAILAICLLAIPVFVGAQTTTPPAELQNPSLRPTPKPQVAARTTNQALTRLEERKNGIKPFSRIAIGGGISTMGINMQVATNLSSHFNLRGVGNYLDYTLNDVEIDSYMVNGNLKFATGGVAVDYFPWAFHGLRLSAGAMFYNENNANASIRVKGGTTLSLNDYDYYSSSTNPITGVGGMKFNTRKPTPTVTIGWGNLINRRGGHWSFPVELGAAMMDTPAVNIALNGGQACDAYGANCVNGATDPTVQANLNAQIDKYKKNLSQYGFYPIFSFGVGYNFKIR